MKFVLSFIFVHIVRYRGVLFTMEVYFLSKNSTHYSEIQSAILQTHVARLHTAMSHTNSHSCNQEASLAISQY
jgi:hypothetical protein